MTTLPWARLDSPVGSGDSSLRDQYRAYTDVVIAGLVLICEFVAAVVDGVLGDVLMHVRRCRVVHHVDDCDAQVHAQAVDVQEAEERQQRQDKSARRELYAVTPAQLPAA